MTNSNARETEGRLLPDFIYRPRQVERFTGYKSTQLWELIGTGKFPPPVRLSEGGKAVGWFGRVLIQWQTELEAEAKRAVVATSGVADTTNHRPRHGRQHPQPKRA